MHIRGLLEGGTRRSLGRSGEAVNLVLAEPGHFSGLIECLWDSDPVVRMRAADAAEKVSAARPALLQPFKRELLTLLDEERQQEVRWHLALMIPRLAMTALERLQVYQALRSWLGDQGSLVRAHAMQGLADLVKQDRRMRPEIVGVLREMTRSGTPAMRARGRKLLNELET